MSGDEALSARTLTSRDLLLEDKHSLLRDAEHREPAAITVCVLKTQPRSTFEAGCAGEQD